MNTVLFVAFLMLLAALVLPWIMPLLAGDICNPLKRYANWVWGFMESKGWIK